MMYNCLRDNSLDAKCFGKEDNLNTECVKHPLKFYLDIVILYFLQAVYFM
jgi:hypothetical protein